MTSIISSICHDFFVTLRIGKQSSTLLRSQAGLDGDFVSKQLPRRLAVSSNLDYLHDSASLQKNRQLLLVQELGWGSAIHTHMSIETIPNK